MARIMTTSSALSPNPGRDRGSGWRAYRGNRWGCQHSRPVGTRAGGAPGPQLWVAIRRSTSPLELQKPIVSRMRLYPRFFAEYLSTVVDSMGWVHEEFSFWIVGYRRHVRDFRGAGTCGASSGSRAGQRSLGSRNRCVGRLAGHRRRAGNPGVRLGTEPSRGRLTSGSDGSERKGSLAGPFFISGSSLPARRR